MCGLVGFWSPYTQLGEGTLHSMTDRIQRRGPDSSGHWLDEAHGIGLGHRRLAVVDLSPSGHQPMHSATGDLVLSYNGEIYNHHHLRRQLADNGVENAMQGQSDTQVLLMMLEHWGIDRSLAAIEGMFAFALWDRKKKKLTLARDRLGEKPMYFGKDIATGALLFGSELSAFHGIEGFAPRISAPSLTAFIRHGYVPDALCIYHNFSKLLPGHYVEFNQPTQPPNLVQYWNAEHWAHQPKLVGTDAELMDQLDAHLQRSIGQQTVADVPLGAFLSGGYDSSLVAAVMQSQSDKPVKTFTIGFHEDDFNEATYAKQVAGVLNTDHTELYVSAQQALDVVPNIAQFWSEPFADSSQIPTFLVSQLARQSVTVSLSGDGGDELFSGYSRYRLAERLWGSVGRLPKFARGVVSGTLQMAPLGLIDAAQSILPKRLQVRHLADRGPKLVQLFAYENQLAFYKTLMSSSPNAESMMQTKAPYTDVYDHAVTQWQNLSFTEQMALADIKSYLPGDILTKVDRASMAVNLEARAPMLDHRLVEFALQLPTSIKRRDGDSKWILKQVTHRYLPKSLMQRPKQGFSVPIEHWLRGPLRDWGEALLDERRLCEQGMLDPAAVRAMWSQHQKGQARHHSQLWSVLMLQSWLDNVPSVQW